LRLEHFPDVLNDGIASKAEYEQNKYEKDDKGDIAVISTPRW
jgi:hypothetical protein